MKSIKEIAEEIANDAYKVNSNKFTIARDIEKALRDRDERAAKIADADADLCGFASDGQATGRRIAAAIRKVISHDSKTT